MNSDLFLSRQKILGYMFSLIKQQVKHRLTFPLKTKKFFESVRFVTDYAPYVAGGAFATLATVYAQMHEKGAIPINEMEKIVALSVYLFLFSLGGRLLYEFCYSIISAYSYEKHLVTLDRAADSSGSRLKLLGSFLLLEFVYTLVTFVMYIYVFYCLAMGLIFAFLAHDFSLLVYTSGIFGFNSKIILPII